MWILLPWHKWRTTTTNKKGRAREILEHFDATDAVGFWRDAPVLSKSPSSRIPTHTRRISVSKSRQSHGREIEVYEKMLMKLFLIRHYATATPSIAGSRELCLQTGFIIEHPGVYVCLQTRILNTCRASLFCISLLIAFEVSKFVKAIKHFHSIDHQISTNIHDTHWKLSMKMNAASLDDAGRLLATSEKRKIHLYLFSLARSPSKQLYGNNQLFAGSRGSTTNDLVRNKPFMDQRRGRPPSPKTTTTVTLIVKRTPNARASPPTPPIYPKRSKDDETTKRTT